MAVESNDSATIQNSINDIINVCTMSEKFDINEIPIIDIEYYFLNLRAKSVSEVVESKYRCTNEIEEGKQCGNTIETKINLTEIKPEADEIVDPEIKITDSIIVKMRYPVYGIMKDSLEAKNVTEMTFKLIASCIEYIYDGEQFYYANETPEEELLEFVESLNQQQFERMEHFFNNMPKMKKRIEAKCSKCGYEHSFDVEGLESFFG